MQIGTSRSMSNATQRLRVRKAQVSLGTMLLVAAAVLLIGTLPGWPHSQTWGYGPSGGIVVAMLGLVSLWMTGKL